MHAWMAINAACMRTNQQLHGLCAWELANCLQRAATRGKACNA